MAEFKKVVITKDGQALMAKLMSGAGTAEFTKIAVSSTTYSDSQLENLTSLAGIKQEAEISKVTRNNNVSVQVEGAISNIDVTVGYYMQTLGLYARDPQKGEILYAVTNASVAGYMPPFNDRTPSGAYFKLVTTIGNADNVTLQVDPAAVATIGDIDNLQKQISDIQAYVGYNDEQIVGIEADLQNRRVTRIAGAVNRTPGASFDDIRAFGGRRRCTVADDGEVLGYYGESGYDETGETGQVMVEQPKFYYKVVPLKLDKIEDGKGFHMRKARYYVSDSPKAGFKIHPAFVDENGKIRQYIYLSAFEGSIFDVSNDTYLKKDEQIADFNADTLSSIPGAKPASGLSQSLSRGNTRKLAQNRGEGWEQAYSATASLTQLLFIVEYASFNTQDALGYGVLNRESGEGNESEITGATTSLGNQSGFIMVNDSEVPTFRGEENWYGNIWKWVDGLNIKPQDIHELYVATHGFADDTGEAPYENAGFTLAKSNGYVSAFGYTEGFDWLFFPSETSGNNSVPVGDRFSQNNKSTASWFMAMLGGDWSAGVIGGGFNWYVYDSSGGSDRTRGGRLVYVPKGGN